MRQQFSLWITNGEDQGTLQHCPDPNNDAQTENVGDNPEEHDNMHHSETYNLDDTSEQQQQNIAGEEIEITHMPPLPRRGSRE